MGAWGVGSFENDDALDWIALLQRDGEKAIAAAFASAENTEYLDVDVGSDIVAAAEAVAAMNGNIMQKAPRELVTWTAGRSMPSPELIQRARAAIKRILHGSELHDLWEESGEFEAWRADIEGLLGRLE